MNFISQRKFLVLSGGGVNGLCHVGGLRVLKAVLGKDLKEHFKGFAGTSVGAFISLSLVCGLGLSDILRLFDKCKSSLPGINVSWSNFHQTKGACFDFFPLDFIITEALLAVTDLDNISFADLHKTTHKELVVVTTDLLSSTPCYFSRETTPNVSVKTAVMASMAIPTLFPPVRINDKLHSDGGMSMNFPFCVFPATETIGLWLQQRHRETQAVDELLSSSVEFFKSIVRCFYHTQDSVMNEILLPMHRERIVVIPNGCNNFLQTREDMMENAHMEKQGFLATLFHLHHFHHLSDSKLARVLQVGFARRILKRPSSTNKAVFRATLIRIFLFLLVQGQLVRHINLKMSG